MHNQPSVCVFVPMGTRPPICIATNSVQKPGGGEDGALDHQCCMQPSPLEESSGGGEPGGGARVSVVPRPKRVQVLQLLPRCRRAVRVPATPFPGAAGPRRRFHPAQHAQQVRPRLSGPDAALLQLQEVGHEGQLGPEHVSQPGALRLGVWRGLPVRQGAACVLGVGGCEERGSRRHACTCRLHGVPDDLVITSRSPGRGLLPRLVPAPVRQGPLTQQPSVVDPAALVLGLGEEGLADQLELRLQSPVGHQCGVRGS